MTDIDQLKTKLRDGVPIIIDRWPGNDGEDRTPDLSLAGLYMREAAEVIELYDHIITRLQVENERYSKALEIIMGKPMDSDSWYSREARKALAEYR